MAYVPFHNVTYAPTQQPNAVGKPTNIPNNTLGNVRARIFSKIASSNIPVVKLIIRRQINT